MHVAGRVDGTGRLDGARRRWTRRARRAAGRCWMRRARPGAAGCAGLGREPLVAPGAASAPGPGSPAGGLQFDIEGVDVSADINPEDIIPVF